MASYRKDGVLYDPLKSISRSVDRAVNLNRDIARSNTQHVAELEKEKNRSLREITQMQKSLIANSSRLVVATTSSSYYNFNHHIVSHAARRSAGGKILTRFASLDEGCYQKQRQRSNTDSNIDSIKNEDGSLSSKDKVMLNNTRTERERTKTDVHSYIDRKRAESFTAGLNPKQDGRLRSGSSKV